ncbi:MAG: hypothetical protein JSS86_14010 [Cyanobacteria bacterium SZAS LIN-2]|nr:hypothetical protein [Cyanobacteria bacterium SZAS LIN-2]
MGVKRKKTGRGTVDDFDATPPDDGDISANGRPKLPRPDFSSSKTGLKKYLDSYQQFLLKSFRNMPRDQQEATVSRFSQVICIGIAVVALQLFYSVLIAQVRIISLPIAVGAAWFLANKLVAPALITRLGSLMNPR